MRKNPVRWSAAQTDAMHWLQRSALKSARAWRLRMGLREVYARARQHNCAEQAAADLGRWVSWARRCRLEPFKKLAATIKDKFDAIVRGMLDHRSNAFVESMNGPDAASQARCTRIPHEQKLHRHRLSGAVTTEALARSSVRLGRRQVRLSRSTRNGIEPAGV